MPVDAIYVIIKYRISAYRNGKEIFTHTVSNKTIAKIGRETHDLIEQLQNCDQVVFDELVIKDGDGERQLPSMTFFTIEAELFHKDDFRDGNNMAVDPFTGADGSIEAE